MITNKDLLTPIIEKKRCSQCIHVINYGWHAVIRESDANPQTVLENLKSAFEYD